ncbi:hypothetical protein YDYSY3_45160 [Paenibacillus chitinolyticus]|uniref:hypothetical protein n=1 Tax=Paenibacillus chitinolyticus TaxID=79263 RepID=UPI0026E4A3F9|nr:hypothetical protein [Paenibacillus chitinolyticus]GKS13516.1 hypothetical protein YDYSY3_45160 [Paenibacillus chitinolyticus]
MEFEFHITVNNLKLAEKDFFVNICILEQVKPLMIVLDKGDYINQSMCTGIIESTGLFANCERVRKFISGRCMFG